MMRKRNWLKLCGVFLAAAVLAAGCGQADGSEEEKGQDVTAEGAAVSENQEAGEESAAGQEEEESSAQTAGGEQEQGNETQEADGFPEQMPAFTTRDLAGNEITESIFGEKDLTVLNIWGTFCPPCIGEMPQLGQWAKDMPENVQLVGLIVDIEGEEDQTHRDLAVEIMDRAGADFTQLIANADFIPVIRWVVGVPTTLFVDSDGNLVGEPVVGADVDRYRQFVEEYLSE